ncbi:MAG: cell division protein FtsA [Candidatus Saccharimonadales bacterium]
MRDPAATYYVGLDIGTSSVRCVVGTRNDNDSGVVSVIGHGSSQNAGMRKGMVMHVDEVAEAIVQAVTEAERLSGVHIDQATINVNGSQVVGINSKGVVAISSPHREITIEDRERVEEAATIVQLPPNREIIQVFAKDYRLDGQSNIKDPVGMQGVRLEVDCHIVTASTPNVRNLDLALEKAQVRPSHHTVSGLASVEAVLDRKQKEAGTVLVDIGAGTTNMVVIEDGEIQHVAVIPVGGINVTNDLAIGLKTDLDVAEEVKIKYASLAETKESKVKLSLGNQTHEFDRSEINMIVEARIEELLEYVDKELHGIRRSRKLPGGVVLVGGVAALPGLAEFTKDKLQLAARIGKIRNLSGLVDTVDDPAFSTASGLMLLDGLLSSTAGGSSDHPLGFDNLNLLNRVFEKIKRYKK